VRAFKDLPPDYQELYKQRYKDGGPYPDGFEYSKTPEGHNWWWSVFHGDLPEIPMEIPTEAIYTPERDFVQPLNRSKPSLTDSMMNILNMLL
jgi:hypothetical protein